MEVVDQSADASRLAANRKLDTKPVGNNGEKISVAEWLINLRRILSNVWYRWLYRFQASCSLPS